VDHGRAVQVAPIKPTLKAPGTKRLRLSNVGFKLNLRRYTMAMNLPPFPFFWRPSLTFTGKSIMSIGPATGQGGACWTDETYAESAWH